MATSMSGPLLLNRVNPQVRTVTPNLLNRDFGP